MSDRKNNMQQTQSALRLLEALSGIDEELLERSDAPSALEAIAQRNVTEKVTNTSEIHKRRKISVVYRNAVAACIGFVVVGVLSWNALRPIWTPKGADSSANETADSPWKLVNNQSAYDMGTQQEDGPTGIAEDAAGGFDRSEVTEDAIEDLEMEKRDCVETESSLAEYENEAGRFNAASGETSNEQKESNENLMSTASPKMELTEAEARSTAVVGAFIPDDIPKGYTFESAYLDGQGAVTIIWHNGMDSILINVSQAVPEDIETSQNTIFKWEDMSLEIVKSLMKSVGDAGDTDTPRGNFSVLYPEGVLLYFNGRGTAEDIWDMLRSAGK